MKSKVLGTCLALLCLTASCGKKSKDEKDQDPATNVQQSKAEAQFHAAADLNQAVLDNNHKEVERVLRENNDLSVNKVTDDGETLLIHAIKEDFQEIRNILLERGANPNKPSLTLETPLMTAVVHNRLNSAKILLDLKVDLNKKNNAGDTALHLAIKFRRDDLALMLIKAGANVEITDAEDKNAFRLAQDFDATSVVELLRSILQAEYGAPDVNTFRSILTQGDNRVLDQLLTRFPRIARDYEMINPLVVAMEASDETAVLRNMNLLVKNFVSVDGPERAEITPLIRSIILRKKSYTTYLLNSNANLEIKDKQGNTALIWALKRNDPSLLYLLVKKGAIKDYSTKVNGVDAEFNACDIAFAMKKKLVSKDDLENINLIIKHLGCGFWDWVF